MLNLISNYVQTILPFKRKVTPSGWTSFNCPCCTHNGESADTRGRGGLHSNTDGSLSYHCFNCHFKTSYQPGRHLTFKFRKFLQWLGAPDSEIKRLVIEAIRIKDLVAPENVKIEPEEKIEFKKRSLPDDARSIQALITFHELSDWQHDHKQFNDALIYIDNRRIDFTKYDIYLSEDTSHKLNKRVIIPFYWENEIIGYTSRAIDNDIKPKYYSNYEPNYVFNTNMQLPDSKFVVVCEGPFDAMSVDGVAVLNNECNETQADIIESLGREVIVVADRDRAGAKMIDNAIEYGWSVSFPVWLETCKDISEAVVKYGKLFVLKTILDSKQTNKLKIELMKKKLYN
jgi:hypothetical protein